MTKKPSTRAQPQPIDYSAKDYNAEDLPIVKLSYAAVLTRSLFYPENQFAKGLAFLMHRMAFTKAEIEHLRQMGFVVEIGVRAVQIPEDCK